MQNDGAQKYQHHTAVCEIDTSESQWGHQANQHESQVKIWDSGMEQGKR